MAIHIDELSPEPFHTLDYVFAAKRGVSQKGQLPFCRATVDRLPDGIDAIVVTADLQGVVSPRDEWSPRLLGIAVAEELSILSELAILPRADRLGVVLAGDFHSDLDAQERGGKGDVREVWDAFRAVSSWVVGTAGNHDGFGKPWELAEFRRKPGIHLLDRETREIGGMRFAGVAGVVGNPLKEWRITAEDMTGVLSRFRSESIDLLVMHEGPEIENRGFAGHPAVNAGLAGWGDALLVRGHCWWPEPLAAVGDVQVLNVDSRLVVLESLRDNVSGARPKR